MLVVCHRIFMRYLFYLNTFTEKGNVTTYEWLYGEVPQRVEINSIEKIIEKDEKQDQSEEIDWDITVGEESDIDFGITIDESGIEVESPQKDASVARGNEALKVLDNPRTRNEFLAEVFEVCFFITD